MKENCQLFDSSASFPRLRWLVFVTWVFCCGLPSGAIDITVTYETNGLEPPDDPDGSKLLALAQYVADQYEDMIEDNHAMEYRIGYDVAGFTNGSFTHLEPNNATNRSTLGRVKINPTPDNDPTKRFYYDPSPADDSEYNMQQWLFRDLSMTQQTDRFNGSTPALFEAGYRGPVSGSAPAAAQGATDLLTILFHEMGHGLGLSGGLSDLYDPDNPDETDDGDFDVNSNLVNGNTMAINVRGTDDGDDRAHVVGSGSAGENFAIMSFNSPNVRRRPSGTDLLSMASIANWTSLDLQRKDLLDSGDWQTALNWLGGASPDSGDEIFVRNGLTTTLSGFGAAGNLFVSEGALVSTQANTLFVQTSANVSGTPGNKSQITINTNGEVDADETNIGQDGIIVLVAASSLLQSEQLNIAPDGELRGQGIVDLNNNVNGLLTSKGLIRATSGGELVITSTNGLGLDLQGGDVEAIDGDIRFETGMLTAMGADMSVGAGRQVAFNFGGTVGTGGSIQLDGTTGSPAIVTGSNLFVDQGGYINANGLGVVENTLLLLPTGTIYTEFGDPNSEVRLNGTSFFQGGSIDGHGIARQNGDALVQADTQIDIVTYDMDGQGEATVITIDPDVTLDINSQSIDTVGANDFDGQINVNSGTLDVETNWQLDGTINLSQTGVSVPVLTGEGILTIRSTGQLNVSGSADINQQLIIEGGVFVASEANFNGTTSFTSTAIVETDGPGDAVDLDGITTMAGGSFIGNGAIKFDNQLFVTQNTSIGMAEADLDGDSGDSEINIQPDVTLSVSSISLDLTANDGFDGVMNLQGTFSSIVAFRLDGQLNMTEFSGAAPPAISGLGSYRIFTSGEMNTDGDALVNRNTTVQGDLNIGVGVTQINGTAAFEPTAAVTVAAGGELEFKGATTFSGGSYTGAGLIQLNAPTTVNSITTISTSRIDLDGENENTQVDVNDVAFLLNVDSIDMTNNLFGGTMNVMGNSASLEVNLNNPLTTWRLASVGTLNLSTTALSPVTMLDGSNLSAEGRVIADGRVRLGVNVELSGTLNTLSSTTDVHFDGGGRSLVHNTATVSGPGAITIDNGSTVNLEDSALVGLDVENDGRLEIGFASNEVMLDYDEPGAALIRGSFAQTTDGELAVDLGGNSQGINFDLLEITGTARLNGTIEVQLIGGFKPMVGNTFQVLTATSVINTFEQILTIDETNMFDFEMTPIYSATDVVLQIDDVYFSADFDHDDDVDGVDFLIWQRGFGLTMQVDNTNGDANGDGLVNDEDLGIWGGQYGLTFSPLVPAGSAVPEPAGCVLLMSATLVLLRLRWRGAVQRMCQETSPFLLSHAASS